MNDDFRYWALNDCRIKLDTMVDHSRWKLHGGLSQLADAINKLVGKKLFDDGFALAMAVGTRLKSAEFYTMIVLITKGHLNYETIGIFACTPYGYLRLHRVKHYNWALMNI